jgi:predicted nucleotidyltransferase
MESRRLLEIKNYQKKLKKLLNKDINDIILFGSFVKDGNAKDIDVALVLKENSNLMDIKKKIKSILKKEADIQVIDLESIYSPIWLTLIKEGFSIKKNKFLADIYNVKPAVLYKYSLKKLTNVQKVQFNRGMKNLLSKEGKILTRSVILVPLSIKNKVMEFLKSWNIYYESQEYELLPVLRKESFL